MDTNPWILSSFYTVGNGVDSEYNTLKYGLLISPLTVWIWADSTTLNSGSSYLYLEFHMYLWLGRVSVTQTQGQSVNGAINHCQQPLKISTHFASLLPVFSHWDYPWHSCHVFIVKQKKIYSLLSYRFYVAPQYPILGRSFSAAACAVLNPLMCHHWFNNLFFNRNFFFNQNRRWNMHRCH